MRFFLPGFLLSLSLCLDLGVVNVALIHLGLRSGVRPAFLLGLGSSIGDLVYAVLALTAVSIVLRDPLVRQVLWAAGTVVLTVLTIRMVWHAGRSESFVAAQSDSRLQPSGASKTRRAGAERGEAPAAAASSESASRGAAASGGGAPRALREAVRAREGSAAFARGIGLALASPSAILWFAAVGGSTIASHAGDQLGLLGFLGGFFCAGVLWSLGLAIVVGRGRAYLGPRVVRLLMVASAVLFAYLAVSVGVTGYREFVLRK